MHAFITYMRICNECMYVCTYVCLYIRTECTYGCMYMCVYISMHVCIYVCICVCVCVCRIAVDVRQEVYCTAVKTGGRRAWEFLVQRYHAAVHKPSESDVLLASLVCTRHEWLLLT